MTRELGGGESPPASVSTHDGEASETRDLVDIDLPDCESAPPPVEDELTHGDFVGRYSVLSRLGRGGMGVVYKAYDPQLDRNVALKLLRRGRGSVEADLRLLREAQTLAQLKHPNVVAVYDAGLTNHGVFIAMELLEGETLSVWLEQTPRSVSEILAVFQAAGRGLVAAHDAGFVHRDFKPSNVIVESNGAVRVLDFGLAHLVTEPLPESSADVTSPDAERRSASGESPASVREVFSTDEGTVMGTPAFMAPEQLLGGPSDQRSEQFAFAMSLFVAIYDRSPLGGKTYEERKKTIESGVRIAEVELKRSAGGERVPGRIRRVIVRGLATKPQQRFGSMRLMLAELAEPRRRWWEAAAASTLVLGFGVGAMVFGGEAKPQPCSDPTAALDGTWSDADRSAVEAALDRSAVGSQHHVVEELDRYADAWVRMYGDSCRATFVSQRQSELLFDQRMRCLSRRRNRLGSAIDSLMFAEGKQQMVQRVIAPFKLPPIEPCADIDFVMAERPLEDEAERERVARLRQRIDELVTLHDVGDYARGLEQAKTALADAEALGYPPVLAEVLETLGMFYLGVGQAADAEQILERAIRVGAAAHQERVVATAWTLLLFAKARQDRIEEGLVLELPAQAAVERVGDDVIHSWLLNSLGVLQAQRGEYATSLEHLRRAQALKIETLGEDHVDVGISWLNLGNALSKAGSYEEAEAALSQAEAIFEATVGRVHPLSHYALRALGLVALARGDAQAALAPLEAARSDFEDAPPGWISEVSLVLARAQWLTHAQGAALQTAAAGRAAAGEDAELIEEIDRWQRDPAAYEQDLDAESRGPGQARP